MSEKLVEIKDLEISFGDYQQGGNFLSCRRVW